MWHEETQRTDLQGHSKNFFSREQELFMNSLHRHCSYHNIKYSDFKAKIFKASL